MTDDAVPQHRAASPKPRTWVRVLVPALLIALWLGVTATGGQIFGVISEVTTDDQVTFLPAEAESTRALELQQEFDDTDAAPATVIAELQDGSVDEQTLAELAPSLETLGEVEGASEVIGPIPSEDGEAIQIIVLLDESAIGEGAVGDLRDAVDDELDEDTWTSHVTGPAALSSDLSEAFAGVDGLLLLVAVVAVFVILVIVYRSIILPVLVLLSSIAALCAAIAVVYAMASADWIQLNGQVQGILSILVIGAATDYSLLFVARYREELLGDADRFVALRRAWRRSAPPILASGGTVAIALLCLLVSDLNSNRALGPVAASGIVFSMLATLTFLPALLAATGRPVFWPRIPRAQDGPAAIEKGESTGLWERVAAVVRRRPRRTWLVVTAVLIVGAVGVVDLRAEGIAQNEVVLGETDTKAGQDLVEEHFDAGATSPADVFVEESAAEEAAEVVAADSGVASVSYVGEDGATVTDLGEAEVVDGKVRLSVTLTDPADSLAAEDTVRDLRSALADVAAETLVGGTTATQLDTNETASRDLLVIVPIVLVVIGIILVLLLRAIVTPLILIGTTVLSYLTALGVSALVFNYVFGFPGADPSVPLYGFMFLVALGVDYNIFLMTRAREETPQRGAAEGLLRSLVVTGGVITSAGIVLAATFTALAVLPIMFMVQLAFLVAFGVFVDTFIVRTLQVPAMGVDLDRRLWWPSRIGLDRPRRAGQRQGVGSAAQ